MADRDQRLPFGIVLGFQATGRGCSGGAGGEETGEQNPREKTGIADPKLYCTKRVRGGHGR